MRLALWLFLGWAVWGCSDEPARRDIRDHYFPLTDLAEGLVYEYRSLADSNLAPAYWYYRSFLYRDSAFMTATRYDPALLPTQFVREEMVSNGMVVEDMYLYENDSTGAQTRIDVEVVAGNVFPFSVRDSGGIYLFRVEWSPPSEPGTTYRVIKNRRFAGDTTYAYEGRVYDCVVFEVAEQVEHEQEGVWEQRIDGVEFYAEDLGLVYYRKGLTETVDLEYGLARRYPMAELERMFGEMYGEE
jgi:hypothetical protein